jgi:hypothetical protein
MVTAGGNLVTITNNGGTNTFRMNEDNGGFNANFFMLVPAGLNLNVARSGSVITISFPTQAGGTYQIQYKTNLTDPNWTSLGSPVTGTGGFVSVQDTVSGATRFYRAVATGVQ